MYICVRVSRPHRQSALSDPISCVRFLSFILQIFAPLHLPTAGPLFTHTLTLLFFIMHCSCGIVAVVCVCVCVCVRVVVLHPLKRKSHCHCQLLRVRAAPVGQCITTSGGGGGSNSISAVSCWPTSDRNILLWGLIYFMNIQCIFFSLLLFTMKSVCCVICVALRAYC